MKVRSLVEQKKKLKKQTYIILMEVSATSGKDDVEFSIVKAVNKLDTIKAVEHIRIVKKENL